MLAELTERHGIYERIVVVGRSIVAARLTPAAYANGPALALPQVGSLGAPGGLEARTELPRAGRRAKQALRRQPPRYETKRAIAAAIAPGCS